MDPASIILIITQVMQLASLAAQAGQEITPFAKALYENLIEGKDVTAEDLAKLQAQTDALSAELQKPLPPEEE